MLLNAQTSVFAHRGLISRQWVFLRVSVQFKRPDTFFPHIVENFYFVGERCDRSWIRQLDVYLKLSLDVKIVDSSRVVVFISFFVFFNIFLTGDAIIPYCKSHNLDRSHVTVFATYVVCLLNSFASTRNIPLIKQRIDVNHLINKRISLLTFSDYYRKNKEVNHNQFKKEMIYSEYKPEPDYSENNTEPCYIADNVAVNHRKNIAKFWSHKH